MGSQRDKIKERMRPGVEQMLEPGEQVRASAQVLVGPSPWLVGGLAMLLFSRFRFLVVTDRRVLFVKTGAGLKPRPSGLAFSDPLSPTALVQYRRRLLWSVIKYRRPDGSILRLNINRLWIPDLDQVAAALRQGTPMPTNPETTPPTVPPAPPV